MNLFWICLKIFGARILDVTIATFRQNILMKGRYVVGSILAFVEIMIWFIVAREALTISVHGIYIPIAYSLGYATGTWLGSMLSKYFIKGVVGMEIIIDEESKEIINSLKMRGYSFNVLHIESGFKSDPKLMIFIEVQTKSVKKIECLVRKIEPDAFIAISDTKKVYNGTLK